MASFGHPASFLRAKMINIDDDDEIQFWMREFGIGGSELYAAIGVVGTSARIVEEYLSNDTGSVPRSAARAAETPGLSHPWTAFRPFRLA